MIRNGIDWEGMGLNDDYRYNKIRRVLKTELEDIDTSGLLRREVENISPEDLFDKNLEKEYCHKILSHLSNSDRKILMHLMEGYSSVEISKLYGKSSSWSSGRVRFTRWKLKNISRKLGLLDFFEEGRLDCLRSIWDIEDDVVTSKYFAKLS